MQENSPFIDVRDVEKDKLREYIADFFINLTENKTDISGDNISAYEHAKFLFGEKITDEVIAPAFTKLFAIDAKALNNENK